ncbi:MAG: hypothetical protein GF375_07910, partial [Candidatus Omnitrophica bacterium]|nr:hypothetical protein [Candidatus Omnitrophota bacterium]MBD3269887.1 hypothetical protein [Candidatus Omnitrophota bacterium]
MLCDICKKNTATVHLTEIVKDKIVEMHICKSCAQEKSGEIKGQFQKPDSPSGLSAGENIKKSSEYLKCPKCGMFFKDFKRKGKFGCDNCYEAFKEIIIPLVKKIHASDKHRGKSPYGAGERDEVEMELRALNWSLKRAIKLE